MNGPTTQQQFLTWTVEATIRIALVAGLVAWCLLILSPFLVPIVWGVIIAVAASGGYRRIETSLGGRKGLAGTLFVLLGMVLLILPAAMLADTLVVGVEALAERLRAGDLRIPPPPEAVAGWPLIGSRLAAFWQEASDDLRLALQPLAPQLKAVGGWLLSAAAGAGLGVLQFLAAIVIAGVLLAHSAGGAQAARALAGRLAGERGAEFANLAETTVRSVARGILGVALIQATLLGLGLLVMGIPGAGLWALVALVLSVIQIGVGPVVIPILIYAFYTAATVPFIVFLVYMGAVTTIDNVLKPILLGRGVQVPMVVIFLGAIGGFLTSGIVGLFIGAVVLALGYRLVLAWLYGDAASNSPRSQQGGSAPPGTSPSGP